MVIHSFNGNQLDTNQDTGPRRTYGCRIHQVEDPWTHVSPYYSQWRAAWELRVVDAPVPGPGGARGAYSSSQSLLGRGPPSIHRQREKNKLLFNTH
jgi:hypothetical protein